MLPRAEAEGAGLAVVHGGAEPAVVHGGTTPIEVLGGAEPTVVLGGAGPALVLGGADSAATSGTQRQESGAAIATDRGASVSAAAALDPDAACPLPRCGQWSAQRDRPS